MRLIDADLLKAAVPEVDPDSYEDCDNCDMMGDIAVRDLIDAAPTVDAVPVVRCKECRYYTSHVCIHPNGMRYTPGDDYCSLGLRPENASDGRL